MGSGRLNVVLQAKRTRTGRSEAQRTESGVHDENLASSFDAPGNA